MEVNSISRDLKEFYRNKETNEILGVNFSIESEVNKNISIFKSGFWFISPFAFESYDSHAIKLSPHLTIEKSPIVSFSRSNSKMLSPKLSDYLTFIQLSYMNSVDMLNDIVREYWSDFKILSKPFLDYTKSSHSFDFLEEYIFSEKIEKILQDKENGYSEVYMDFWNHYNDSPSQRAYNELVSNLENDFKYLPNDLNIDYGIWTSRVNSVLAQRAYGMLRMDFEKKEKYLWNYISQAHGFDAEGASFSVVPSSSSDTYLSMSSILNKFDTNTDLNIKFSDKVKKNPLFEAIQDLRVKQPGYLGEMHVEAAAILDTEYNDPYGAWDALVTASYWAGRNHSKAIEPMWEAAIYLSEKHNWKEIHEVLVQQYEYYNFYKDKV